MTPPAGLPTGWAIAIAVIVALLGTAGLSSILTVRAMNRRTLSEARKAAEDADLADASARKVVAEASAMLLEPLMRRAKALEEQLTAAQVEVQELRGQVHQMTKEMGVLRDENRNLREHPPTPS